MNKFWLHKDLVNDNNNGYGQFSKKHFLLLFISILFIFFYCVYYINADAAHKILSLRIIAAILMIIEVIKFTVMAITKVNVLNNLPLEICSFGAYFIVIDSILLNNHIVLQMLLTLFLPAAIMAILFPTSTALPAINFFTFHQFLYHDLIIAYVVARFINGDIIVRYAYVWPAILRLVMIAFVVYIIDCVFDKNFMFLRGSYGNFMLDIIKKKTGGGIRYTIGLVAFSIFMTHIFFVIFKLISLLI